MWPPIASGHAWTFGRINNQTQQNEKLDLSLSDSVWSRVTLAFGTYGDVNSISRRWGHEGKRKCEEDYRKTCPQEKVGFLWRCLISWLLLTTNASWLCFLSSGKEAIHIKQTVVNFWTFESATYWQNIQYSHSGKTTWFIKKEKRSLNKSKNLFQLPY